MSKVAVVTGGATGIGFETVKCLIGQGFKVAAFGLESSSEFDELDALFVDCDVSQLAQVESAFEAVAREYGASIAALVNNAGMLSYGDAVELSESDWDRVMAVNVKGPWLCAKYAIPRMQKSGGIVVNVASVQSFVAQPFVAAYATSKAAILGLTRSIAIDFGPAVRCVAVCPGTIDTPMLHGALQQASDPDAMLAELNATHLTGRIGKPQEVGELIAFLCGDKCTFITGQAIRVDGGLGINVGGSKN